MLPSYSLNATAVEVRRYSTPRGVATPGPNPRALDVGARRLVWPTHTLACSLALDGTRVPIPWFVLYVRGIVSASARCLAAFPEHVITCPLTSSLTLAVYSPTLGGLLRRAAAGEVSRVVVEPSSSAPTSDAPSMTSSRQVLRAGMLQRALNR